MNILIKTSNNFLIAICLYRYLKLIYFLKIIRRKYINNCKNILRSLLTKLNSLY